MVEIQLKTLIALGIATINVKMRGHYAYYGITFNSKGIIRFYEHVKRILFNWLNRRGGKSIWLWDRFSLLIYKWIPLLKPFIVHSYVTSKRN